MPDRVRGPRKTRFAARPWGAMRGRGEREWGRIARIGAAGALAMALANCSSSDQFTAKVDPRYGVAASQRVAEPGERIPKGGGTYRLGNPYVVAGQTYVPEENTNYSAEGLASWYGGRFHGRRTANGETFDENSISAAHPTLPLPCYVRVTNLANKRSIVVRVNDRGPYRGNRVIDLSVRTAHLLGFHGNGLARVRVEYVGPARLDGSDDAMLTATLRHGTPAPAPSTVMLASAKPCVPAAPERWHAARGPLPVPPERPFTLGERVDEAPEPRANAVTARSRVEQTFASQTRSGEPIMAPVRTSGPFTATASAYAPVTAGGTVSFVSGRGLY
jgi:rare lipoprotein A